MFMVYFMMTCNAGSRDLEARRCDHCSKHNYIHAPCVKQRTLKTIHYPNIGECPHPSGGTVTPKKCASKIIFPEMERTGQN